MNILRAINRLAISKDPLARFGLLHRIGRVLLPEYRFKWPQMEWWKDPFFNKYLNRFNEVSGMNTDRRWMLYQLMRLTERVPGDTVECGVFEGAGSYMFCKMNRENQSFDRTHYIFDSFEGVSKPAGDDGMHWTEGDLSCPLDTVKGNLSEFDNVSFHKGWIPEKFADVENKRFSFVHIDVDLYQPTLDSIAFFYSRMNVGGIIVCDDYGFTSCPGATKAINEFLEDKEEKMIFLSGGGGFLIKGTVVSLQLK